MQAACFCSSGSTLKPCFSTVTPSGPPSVGIPSFDIQDRNGYSLPPNQTPSVWPLNLSVEVTPASLRQVSSIPERLNGWAMLTSGSPFSRAASAEGIQSTITSAPPPASTCAGAMSGPPGLMVDVEPLVLVEALRLGDVIAGELRLGHPLQLQRHVLGPGGAPPRRQRRGRSRRNPLVIIFLFFFPC